MAEGKELYKSMDFKQLSDEHIRLSKKMRKALQDFSLPMPSCNRVAYARGVINGCLTPSGKICAIELLVRDGVIKPEEAVGILSDIKCEG